ncbi:MAG: FtsX-like permease family protein [Bdellovibrionaceae bacterium]|nr:FtsX-like permease family protein [Pseudobdellovibrionaceae bacterium]
MRAILYLAWRNLFRNTRRTAASLVTVAFGATGLLIFQGFNEGLMNQYRENTIRVRFGHGQVFPKGYFEQVFEQPWKQWIEDRAGVEAGLSSIPQVKGVYPRIGFFSFVIKGGINLAARGEGVLPERENEFFSRMNFEAGRDLRDAGEIVIGKGLAHSLDVKVGDTITLLGQTIHGQMNGADLIVAGIFHTGKKDFDDGFFRVHLDAAQRLLDTTRIEHFALQTGGVEDWPVVSQAITEKLPQLEAKPFEDLDAVYYKNSVQFLNTQFSFIRSIMLIIVALGIFNTIAVGLLERAGEVGALRANGESRSRLFSIYLCESFFLGLIGGAIGIGAAVILDKTLLAGGIPMPPGPGITRQYFILLEIQPSHFVQSLSLPALTTVLASLWPIWNLTRKAIPALLRAN